MSAPIFSTAVNACPGSSNIAPINSAGLSSTVSAAATSAVIITSLPFSSWRTSTGVSAGKSS
jgi:hypothetical protein